MREAWPDRVKPVTTVLSLGVAGIPQMTGLYGKVAAGALAAMLMIEPGSAQEPEVPAAPILRSYKPVTTERLKKPDDSDWLMVRGTYDGWGYTPLAQITPDNVRRLQPEWVFATGVRTWST